MKAVLLWASVALLGLIAAASPATEHEYKEDDDFVVIEAARGFARHGRQFPFYQLTQSYQADVSTCYTTSGSLGHCATLKSCYPYHNFRSDTPNWAIGQQDSGCQNSFESTGRASVYSVCCSSDPREQPLGLSPFEEGAGGIGFPDVGQAATHAPEDLTFPPFITWPPPQVPHPPGLPTVEAPPPQSPQHQEPTSTTTPTSAPVPSTQPSPPLPATVGGCGRGRNPIKYLENGTDVEANQRVYGEHPLRIKGGWPAEPNEWPWIAALLNNGRQFCGGSLIDDRHILTAAHCVAEMTRSDVAALTVRLGAHDIHDLSDPKTFQSKVARVVRHKGFSSTTLHNDVALLTLEEPVPASYSDSIRPVCLPQGNERYEGKFATVVGWGSLYEGGPPPAALQELTMEVWKNDKCNSDYGSVAPGGITEHMLCAGELGKDSCSGDSGGPLVVGEGSTWTQIGVVSWGIGCGKSDYPGVYTRTSNMGPWIQRVQAKF